jgi:hypothetical protein
MHKNIYDHVYQVHNHPTKHERAIGQRDALTPVFASPSLHAVPAQDRF